MDLRYSESDEAFRTELRSWLERTLPELPTRPSWDDWAGRRRFDTDWQRRLYDAGYAAINWPKAYGGRDASPSEQLVSGSAIVRPQQEADAIARAVLDATNRRLAYISPS